MRSPYTNSNLPRNAKIVSVLDIVFCVAGIAVGVYCLVHGFLFQIPEPYRWITAGFVLLPLSLINLGTAVMLIVGVAKSSRALLAVWMVKACLLIVLYFPLLPIVLMLYRELGDRHVAVISKPDLQPDQRHHQEPFSVISTQSGMSSEWPRHEYTPSQTYSEQMETAYQISKE